MINENGNTTEACASHRLVLKHTPRKQKLLDYSHLSCHASTPVAAARHAIAEMPSSSANRDRATKNSTPTRAGPATAAATSPASSSPLGNDGDDGGSRTHRRGFPRGLPPRPTTSSATSTLRADDDPVVAVAVAEDVPSSSSSSSSSSSPSPSPSPPPPLLPPPRRNNAATTKTTTTASSPSR